MVGCPAFGRSRQFCEQRGEPRARRRPAPPRAVCAFCPTSSCGFWRFLALFRGPLRRPEASRSARCHLGACRALLRRPAPY